jgi:hypothetical protein
MKPALAERGVDFTGLSKARMDTTTDAANMAQAAGDSARGDASLRR